MRARTLPSIPDLRPTDPFRRFRFVSHGNSSPSQDPGPRIDQWKHVRRYSGVIAQRPVMFHAKPKPAPKCAGQRSALG